MNARTEGAARAPTKRPPAKPTATPEASALEVIRDQIIAEDPVFWEAHRLTPLQHGLDAMIERFKV